jgi:hypothetical protein
MHTNWKHTKSIYEIIFISINNYDKIRFLIEILSGNFSS